MPYKTFLTILVPAIVAFIITVIVTRFFITYMKGAGVTVIDHNKKKRPILASSGGIAVAFGFAMGLFTYIFGASFDLYIPTSSLLYLFAAVIAVALISFTGFIDDINVTKKLVKSTDLMDTHKGLKQWQKPLFTLVGAIPLMAINAGVSTISVPFLGMIDFGILYPLIIVPLAVIFASNAFNLLGGFDGIIAGSGLVASLGLLLYSLVFGTTNGAIISGALFAAIAGFMVYTVYPARIVPGDSFTYAVGTGLVAAMILGNMESFGVIIFLPWIIEFILHARKRFHVTDLGVLQKDGTFKSKYGKKIYSWTHFIMNIRPMKEWQISATMWAISALFVALGFSMKYLGLL
ncbi:MAG: hypothetical protein KGH60_02595 [Candidatus Micrarchaeota archaeon]|nr:hypothetical protein [Candidatus Micrarchaeota archaeon]